MDMYTEQIAKSEPMRELYAESVNNAARLMRQWATNERMSRITPKAMACSRELFREEYASLLGIDVCNKVFGCGVPECERNFVGEDSLTQIERMKIKIAEGVYFTGLLLIPHNRSEKAPLVIMSHGGGGSPELCCDLIGPNNYGGVVRGLLKEGVIVFAHQLLLWNLNAKLCESAIPCYTTPYNRLASDNDFKQGGASIAGFEIYCISRTLGYLLENLPVDKEKCGMLGLSYGGFYTMYTMAYDTRIKLGFSAACYNDRIKYDWQDMVWKGSARSFLDPEVAGLCAPRMLIIDIGREDSVFEFCSGEAQKERTFEFFNAADAQENLRFNVWDGAHKISPESFEVFKDWLKK